MGVPRGSWAVALPVVWLATELPIATAHGAVAGRPKPEVRRGSILAAPQTARWAVHWPNALPVAIAPRRTMSFATSGSYQRPIIGGEPSTGATDEAVVALTIAGQVYCTGTLVAPRLVVTAGHCVDASNGPLTDVRVFFGATLASGGSPSLPGGGGQGVFIPVVGGGPHPQFDDTTYDNDIGVLRLAMDGPATVASLPADPPSPLTVGLPLRLVGYGVTTAADRDSRASAGLRRTVATTVTGVDVRTIAYGTSSENTCYGDSGGPSFAVDEVGVERLVGVTSTGDADCSVFGVNTRVDAFLAGYLRPLLPAVREPSCSGGDECVERCRYPDPDCPARCALDELCETRCAADPDCIGVCVADGVCQSVCGPQDPDCPAALVARGGGACGVADGPRPWPTAVGLWALLVGGWAGARRRRRSRQSKVCNQAAG